MILPSMPVGGAILKPPPPKPERFQTSDSLFSFGLLKPFRWIYGFFEPIVARWYLSPDALARARVTVYWHLFGRRIKAPFLESFLGLNRSGRSKWFVRTASGAEINPQIGTMTS